MLLVGLLIVGTTGFAADIDHAAGHGAGAVHEVAATHPADTGHGTGLDHEASDAHGAGAAHPTGPAYDEAATLARSQAAMGRQVGDYEFLDGEGRRVTLTALRGKPVVISLVYTSCYHICPTVTTNLARVVKIAQEALGEDSFSVLTIGFDTPVDTPDRTREFGRQARDIDNWHFVSASAETMKRLTDDVGFLYFKSPKGFDHLIQATVLDADGKVYHQIYGMAPEPPALVEPLKEVLYGNPVAASPIKSLMNNIRLFCTVYDPTTGRYHFDYSLFVSIAIGLLTLGATAVFIVHAWRKHPPPGPAV
jgi:protein SCO1/2